MTTAKHLTETDIQELKKVLTQNLTQTETRLTELKVQDPYQDPDHVSDNADSGSESREEDGHDRIQAQIDELTVEKEAIEKALSKISDGSYGICEVTGQEIPRERLFAMPTATTVVGAS